MRDTSDTAATEPSSQEGIFPVTAKNKLSSRKASTANKSERTPRVRDVKRRRKPVKPKRARRLAKPLVYNQDVRSSPRLSYGLEVRKVSRLLFKLLMNNYVITFLQCFKVGVKYFSGVLKQTPRKSRPATTTPDKVPGSSAILVSRFFLI